MSKIDKLANKIFSLSLYSALKYSSRDRIIMSETQPKRVLTIQSHVAYGHVGNDAATFTLQRLGIEAMPIHTVQFSNHTGYDHFSGEVFSAPQIQKVIDGMMKNGLLDEVDAVLSGYMGSVAIGEVIHNVVDYVREKNPSAIYVCDPVMGDTDVEGGFFVDETIPPFMRQSLDIATIITPNFFEFEVLCGKAITHVHEIVMEARQLIASRETLTTVLITSFRSSSHELCTVAITENEAWRVTTPHCQCVPMPSGMGDTFAALYLGHVLNGDSVCQALSYTTSTLYGLVKSTAQGARDLSLIREQAQIIAPNILYQAQSIQ